MKQFSRAAVLGVPLLLCLQSAHAADRRQQQGDAQASGQSARSQGLFGAHAAAGNGTRSAAPKGPSPNRGHRGGGHDRKGDFDHYEHGDNRYRQVAHRGHHGYRGRTSVGIYLGGPIYADPFWGPPRWGYYSPWYYDPPPRTVIIEREPTVYIQQPAPAPAPAPQAQAPAAPTLWYYCPSPAGYYPHVPQCQQQWVPVDPASLPPASPPQ
ncbi:MAG: hypothetical protein QE509_01075 [Gammaproteobacteria bacterium]|nr:hypothetical protein [Gammaproteobacteria bacterium]